MKKILAILTVVGSMLFALPTAAQASTSTDYALYAGLGAGLNYLANVKAQQQAIKTFNNTNYSYYGGYNYVCTICQSYGISNYPSYSYSRQPYTIISPYAYLYNYNSINNWINLGNYSTNRTSPKSTSSSVTPRFSYDSYSSGLGSSYTYDSFSTTPRSYTYDSYSSAPTVAAQPYVYDSYSSNDNGYDSYSSGDSGYSYDSYASTPLSYYDSF